MTALFVMLAAASTWIGSWTAAPQLVEPGNMPPEPGFADATLRQVIHMTLGGKRVRLRISNEFGDRPLQLDQVSVALSAGADAIKEGSALPLTFGGRQAHLIPPGTMALSDPIDLKVPNFTDLAITIRLHNPNRHVTGHPGSRTTSFLVQGDRLSAATLSDAIEVVHWYFLSGAEVERDHGAAVAILGDSISDGRGSTTDKNTRWPDNLARRLADRSIAVLNQGIGGNRVLGDGLGPSGLSRVDRDVLSQAGVRWLVVSEGINDLGTAPNPQKEATADALIDAYRQIIERCHDRGIKVVGGTLSACGGSFYDSPEMTAAKEKVNAWIRHNGNFDATVDFDAATRQTQDPHRLREEFDSGDHLHLNDAGYRAMADAVDLRLFRP